MDALNQATAMCIDENELGTFFEKLNQQIGSVKEFVSFCIMYKEYKRVIKKLDFNDMLIMALTAPPLKVRALFIDEAQDLSLLQWKVIKHWAQAIEYVCVCGDDDQSIYKFSGATPTGMFDFQNSENAKKVVLEQSHRLPKRVFNIAVELQKSMGDRVEKEYQPRDEKGIVTYCNDDVS